MKPNGKMFAVRMVFLAMCAVCLLSGLSNAETVRGTVKLPVTVHWGTMVLEPGDYEFVVDTAGATRVLTVTSKSTGRSGMILAAGVDDDRVSRVSEMTLANSDAARYVKKLYLNDAGVALEFSAPKVIPKLAQLLP